MEDMVFDPTTEGMDVMDGMDGMDDLFFDHGMPADIGTLDLGGLPDSMDLLYQLDDLHRNGCCQKIAWSKSGCIAYVTRDAKSVRVVSYPLGPDSSAITLDTSYFHRNEGDFVHLYWDTPGTSLAVVDSLGRISVHRSCLSLSQFNATGHYLPNKIDTCNAVVGMQWISSRAPEVRVCTEASRSGDRWQYNALLTGLKVWTHPLPDRECLLFVTRDGILHLLTAQYKPNKVTGELYLSSETTLSTPIATQHLLTHASFVPEDDDHMLVASCNSSNQISVYRLRISWNKPSEEVLRQGAKLQPSVMSTLLASTILEHPAIGANMGCQFPLQITHMLLLPSADPPLSDIPLPPEVIVVATSDDATSEVLLYKLDCVQEKLHSAFETITGISSPADATVVTNYHLRLQEDLEIIRLPLSCVTVRDIRFFTTIGMGLSNGEIDFRTRNELHELRKADDPVLTSMGSIRYQLPDNLSRTQSAFSFNAISVCELVFNNDDEDGTSVIESLPTFTPSNDPSRIIAVLAMHFATACFSYQMIDDILVVFEHNRLHMGLDVYDLIHEFQIASRASEAQSQKLLLLPGVQKSLAAQYKLLSYIGEDVASIRTAWLLLDLHHFCRCIQNACEGMSNEKTAEVWQNEIPTLVWGLVHWYGKTCTHIASEILHLSYCKPQDLLPKAKLSPAIRVMLSSWGRSLLMLACFAISNLSKIRSKVFPHACTSIHAYRGWEELGEFIQRGPIMFNEFYTFLGDVGRPIKAAVEATDMTDDEKGALDRDLIIRGDVPEILRKPIETMCGPALYKLLESVQNTNKLWSAPDYWRWHSDDQRNTESMDRAEQMESTVHWIDVITKLPLVRTKADKPLRECTRCAGCTVIMPGGSSMPHQWLLVMSRACVCGGAWIVVDGRQRGLS